MSNENENEVDRNELYDLLIQINFGQFEGVVTKVNMPPAFMPPGEQAVRASALLRWAENTEAGGCGLKKLQEAVNCVIKPKESKKNLAPPDEETAIYIEREVEKACKQELDSMRAWIVIKSPAGRFGKTTLLKKMEQYINSELNYPSARLSLEEDPDVNQLENHALFFQWFCEMFSFKLSKSIVTDKKVKDLWREWELLSNKTKTRRYFSEYLSSRPWVLLLDDASCLYENYSNSNSSKTEIAMDFFSMLRSWFDDEPIKNMHIILVQSLGHNIDLGKQSPFNVGLRIPLEEFNIDEIQRLAKKYGLDWLGDKESNQLEKIISGEPYHLQYVLQKISAGELNFNSLISNPSPDEYLDQDYLEKVHHRLREPTQERIYRDVIRNPEPVQLNAFYEDVAQKLRNLGLIKFNKGSSRAIAF